MNQKMSLAVSRLLLLVLSVVCYIETSCARPGCKIQLKAFCKIQNGTVSGCLDLIQYGDAGVLIEGSVRGLSAGEHGLHIHEGGDLSNGCGNTGKHYNPFGKNHGAPWIADRHAGDLGNIVANADGVASVSIVNELVHLNRDPNIVGRAIMVHVGRDDLGEGNNEDSLKTGNSGKPLACCTIQPGSSS